MRRILAFASLVLLSSGCTCGSKTQPAQDAAPPTTTAADAGPTFDLELQRNALLAFGNTTPLPVSEEFNEEVPALHPPLERAAKQRPNAELKMKVAREVPYGQLTRLMQTALAFRVPSWELWVEAPTGGLRSVHVLPPGPLPRGNCWARGWVGPDGRVQLGIDIDADAKAGMHGVLVSAKDGQVNGAETAKVLARMDARCEKGQIRLYSQATARVGPVVDLAHALASQSPPPHLAEQLLAVPSVGALDQVDELVK